MTSRTLPRRMLDLFYAHRWRILSLFLGVLAPLSLFGLLSRELLAGQGFSFDEPLLRFAHDLATPQRDLFMLWVSLAGARYGVVPGSFIVLLLLAAWQRRRDTLFFGLATAGAGILNRMAKLFFGRERPKLWVSIAPEQTLSFPSGHAMGSTAFVIALIVLLWPTPWRWPALAIGLLFVPLVGLSRVYLGVHYPSDILAGWTASTAWVLGLSLLLYRAPVKPSSDN